MGEGRGGEDMKRTKQSTFAKRERSEKSTGFAPVGGEDMTHTATHTPGPWNCVDPHVIRGPKNVVVAKTLDSKEGYEIKQANAHLIAAAPAMYEALQDAYEKLCYLAPDKFDDEEHAANWQRDLSTMLAALAQADGKQKVS